MDDYNAAKKIIGDMEKVAKALDVDSFPIYFMGGSACILGRYTERATRDFDFIDLNYPSRLGAVLRYLNDFDMLEYESTILSPSYRERARRLNEFRYLEIYILAREDIVVSKIIRMEPKDIEDMDILLRDCDRKLINDIINEVLQRKDLYESKKKAFVKNLELFWERYDVQGFL